MVTERKVCTYAGCYTIVKNGNRCSEHPYDKRSSTKNSKFYSSRQWRTLRARKIKATPYCEECFEDFITVWADIVDHVIEINDDPSKALDYSNLRSLCRACHNKKTAEEKKKRNETAKKPPSMRIF